MDAAAVLSRNNVQVLGNAENPVLVLVQGFGCDQVIWDGILPYLTDHYRVVLLDHVGTGGSDPDAYDPARHADLAGYQSDLEEVLAALEITDAAVVGHSVAGMMAVAAAVQNPRISRLVLLCSSARYLNDAGYPGSFTAAEAEQVLRAVQANYPLWATSVSPWMVGREPDSVLSTYFAERMCRLRPEYVLDFLRMSLAADVRHLLPRVSAPVLVLQTEADPLTPEAATAYLCEHLPRASRMTLDTRGNMPHISTPALTARAIRDFLEAETV